MKRGLGTHNRRSPGSPAPRLLTAAGDYASAAWTSTLTMGRYMGPWLVAPIEPGVTTGIAAIANGNRQPNYDYRQDVHVRGDTHFSPTSAIVTAGSVQITGGRRGVMRGADFGGLKFSWVKASDQIMFEGLVSDMSATTDQDVFVMGGLSPSNITSGSVSGLYMTVVTVGNSPGIGTPQDVVPGAGISGTGIIAGTKVADFGKANVVAQISGTTMTVASSTGAPLAVGMTIEADGGVVIGTISSGTGPYTLSASATYAAGSRFFAYSTGRGGTYLLDTNHPTPTGNITITTTAPISSASLLQTPGVVTFAQFLRGTNGHGTNKTHWTTVNGPTENSAAISSMTMNGAGTQCTIVLAANPAGGAIPAGTTWAGKNFKTVGVKVATVTQVLTGFSRDWVIVSSSGSGATTTIIATPDITSSGLPAANATADAGTGTFYLMGLNQLPSSETTANSGGNHTDVIVQIDKDRYHAYHWQHNCTGTGNYQPDGIKANSVTSDCVIEESNCNYKWVVGIGSWLDDMQCNISWTGMQSNAVTRAKRWFNCYLDTTARPWVTWAQAPFPNPNLSTTTTRISYAQGTDPVTSKPYLAYGGGIYLGGWLNGSPAADFCPAGTSGFGFTTGASSYFGQRDPAAAEMTAATYTQDIADILSIASAGTHIGWFDVAAPTFPGVIANGNRCIIDLTCDKNFIGIGTSISGRRMVRGRQAVPVGANSFNITATVRGTAISKTFGPYSITGVSAGSSTLTPSAVVSPAPNTTALSSYAFTVGTNGSGANADQIIAVVLDSSSGTPRDIGTVVSAAGTMTLLNYSKITKTDGGTAVLGWYRLSGIAAGATIDVTVNTAAGSAQGCAIYSWTCSGLGVIYDVATAAPAGTSTANVPQTVNVATVSGGAVLAIHSFANAISGVPRRVSAAQNTSPGANSALSVGGTLISASAMTWTGATKINDQTVVGSGTGASALSVISLAPVL